MARANLARCKETFEMSAQMSMGAVTEAKFAEFITTLGGFFAPCVEFAANPEIAGPAVTGTYEEVMQTIAPIWLGFKITRIENSSFEIKAENVIVVSQVYDNHLTDASGVEIPSTANNSLEVLQTVTYDLDGKISAWVQEYDASKILASRQAHHISLCKETCIAQAQLAMGEVTQEMLDEFGKKFAGSFTPTFEMVVNPQIPGPQVTGTFSEVMEVVGPMWIGFKNTKIEQATFSLKGDNAVFVSQVFHQQLTDASGEEVPGAYHVLEMQTTYTYDANGKVSKLVQEFDVAKVEASRKVARKVKELTESAPKVEVVVEAKAPDPVL